MDLDLTPRTLEQEPLIPPAREAIAAQGIECQRFGQPTFNRIRYAEVQKKLHAAPVFSALQVNQQIKHLVPSPASDTLAKSDMSLGLICHGLLLQRESLSKSLREIGAKFPEAVADIQRLIIDSNSEFRSVSDDLLQYTCGRRAEVIELRRKAFKPRSDYMASLLHAIPPSPSHLFEEQALAELFRTHPDLFFRGSSSQSGSQTKSAANVSASNRFKSGHYSSSRSRHSKKTSSGADVKKFHSTSVRKAQGPYGGERFRSGRPEKKSHKQWYAEKKVQRRSALRFLEELGACRCSEKYPPHTFCRIHYTLRSSTAPSPVFRLTSKKVRLSRPAPGDSTYASAGDPRGVKRSVGLFVSDVCSRKERRGRETCSEPEEAQRLFKSKEVSSVEPSEGTSLFAAKRLSREAGPVSGLFPCAHQTTSPQILVHRVQGSDSAMDLPPFRPSQRSLGIFAPVKLGGKSASRDGIRIIVYLDDFLLAHQNPVILKGQAEKAIAFLMNLGWVVNFGKSILSPVKECVFLGLLWNTTKNTVALPPRKRRALKRDLRTLLSNHSWSWVTAKKILGKLNFAAFPVPLGRLHMREMQRACHRLPEWKPRKAFPVPPPALMEMRWWLNHLRASSDIFPRSPDVFMSSDASEKGWGAQIGEKLLSGRWTQCQLKWHINIKELMAIFLSVQLSSDMLKGKTVVVQSDSQTVVSYIRKQGGTRSRLFTSVVSRLLRFCKQQGITLIPQFLPGKLNSIADSLSRGKRLVDWKLSNSLVRRIFQRWGTPEIDLFASNPSRVVNQYVSRDMTDREAAFTDAFSRPWSFNLAWIFPPPALIPRVLCHLNSAQGTYILVVPRWEKVYWRPDLKSRAFAPPIQIRNANRHLLESRTGKHLQQSPKISLEVWKIRGGPPLQGVGPRRTGPY
ncbi:unnamed protein product [Callosobruchus maculatus]|uniref:RNase H type-1 domain-containing protein n=1 Tax=Callosobruchus maculatus TaxID=64391 RepID=A0A653DKI1_CALMS|nr:unnamed protein product [Callosobruchus maculatus]